MKWAGLARHSKARRFTGRLLARRPLRPLLRRLPMQLVAALHRFAAPIDVFGVLPVGDAVTLLIVSHELSATGAPKALLEVIVASRQLGWAVVVAAPSDGPYRSIFQAAGAAVVVSPDVLAYRSRLMTTAAALSGVLVCNTVVTAEIVRAWCHRRPVAWYIHETGLIDTMAADDPSLAGVLAGAMVVWAASQLTADIVGRHGGRAVVLEACSAPLVASFAELPPLNTEPLARFAVLGSIEPRKGQDLLLDAVERLPAALRAGLRVALYGNPLDAAFTERLLGRLPGLPEVRYGGLLAPAATRDAIIGSDAVIISSRDEPLSLVAVEAMSAGRVVVCSRRCGIARYLTHGVDSFVADGCEAPQLAAAIADAMARRADWKTIGEAGRRVYERHFTPERFREQVASTLQGLVRPGR